MKPCSVKVGNKYERLIVQAIEYRQGKRQKSSFAVCKCSCGNDNFIVRTSALQSGNTRSCGCLLSESSRDRVSISNVTHNLSKTRIYRIFHAMKYRCYNSNNPEFKYWGGKGIYIYVIWLMDFHLFYEWAMNNGYQDDLEIDRIDSDKPYVPWNCRWVTELEQARNIKRKKIND